MLSHRKLLGIAAASSLAALAFSRAAQAQDFPPPSSSPRPLMGTVGVVRHQIVRVSLFHHEAEGGQDPCVAPVTIIGPDGALLGTANLQLFPGQGAFADFDLTEGLDKGARRQFHVDVLVPDGHQVGGTAEVFYDMSGETTLLTHPSIIGPDGRVSKGALSMGTVGITSTQRARVSVFHHEAEGVSEPCLIGVQLVGLDGKVLGSSVGLVSPGKGAFFDFDPAAGLGKGERVQFHVHVTAAHPDLVGWSVEGYDEKTGATAWGGLDPSFITGPLQ